MKTITLSERPNQVLDHPPHMNDGIAEENPFYKKMAAIRELGEQIESRKARFVDQSRDLQGRVTDLSERIQGPVFLPWMKKSVDFREAIGLVKQRHETLQGTPSLYGQADSDMVMMEGFRDRILKQTQQLEAVYAEIDAATSAYNQEMESLNNRKQEKTADLLVHYKANTECFPQELLGELSKVLDLPCDELDEEKKALMEILEDYLNDMISMQDLLGSIVDMLNQTNREMVRVYNHDGDQFFEISQDEAREACKYGEGAADDSTKVAKIREQIEAIDRRKNKIREKTAQFDFKAWMSRLDKKFKLIREMSGSFRLATPKITETLRLIDSGNAIISQLTGRLQELCKEI
ncbi:MAG: hypothetical protein K1X28_00220 [Parachlamydiales bacterium]|nr:hypothetical protein [Parachlamydiales bacterium]